MNRVPRLEDKADEEKSSPRVFPVEIWLFIIVAPVLYLPVLHRQVFDASAWELTRWWLENLLAFLTIPLALEGVYHWLLPRWVRRVEGLPRRLLLHLGVATVVSVPLGFLIQQVIARLRTEGPDAMGFTLTCMVITWTVMVPALLVQEYRERARADERRLEASAQAMLRAELQSLQSRTHPHFLFNALNTVASLIPTQPALAEQTVERLADFLRYSLSSSREATVRLGDELDRVRDYLEVQRARFGARLAYSVDVAPAVEGFRVPPLVFLPLVENAVLHGIATRMEGGTVVLSAHAHAQGLEVTVADGGGERGAPGHRGSGIALEDLRRRLVLLYGDRASLQLTPNDLGGMTARIALPEVVAS